MDRSNKNLPRFYAKPLQPVKGPLDDRMQVSRAAICETTTFFNFTGVDLYRVDREMPPLLVPKSSHPYRKSEFVIRREVTLNRKVADSLRDHIAYVGRSTNPTIQAVFDLFNDQYAKAGDGVVLRFEYVIPNDELFADNQTLVHVNTGYLLTAKKDNIPANPFSSDSLVDDMWVSRGTDSASVSYVLADRAGKIGPRFIVNNGNVITLVPVEDFPHEDGLYVRYARPEKDQELQKGFVYHSPEELEGLDWLYKSHREAQHAPSMALTRELELKDLDYETKKLGVAGTIVKHTTELEDRADKRVYESEARQTEAELLREERDHARRELREKERHMAIRDNYEMASMARKDSSEIMKYVGPIAMALFTAIGFMFTKR